MEFIHIVAGGFAGIAVDRHTVPDLVLHNEHAQLLELLAEILDVKADDPVVELHVRAVVEDPERPVDVDLKGRRNALRLCFRLGTQGRVQVAERRHVFRYGVLKVFLIHDGQAPVDDGLLFRFDAAPAPHDQLAEREDEIGLEAQRVVVVGIVEVDVHRVDVVMARGGDMDDLSSKRVDERVVLAFGIADDDVVLRYEENVADLPLCGEGFAASRRPQDQPVRVLELLAVHHDHVVGEGI